MNQLVKMFIFYGDMTSGKTYLAQQLHNVETSYVKVMDNFNCTPKACKKLVKDLTSSHNYYSQLEPDIYVVITWVKEDDLKILTDELKNLDWLSITACEFKKIS